MTVISGTPAYIQVATELRSQIKSGKLRPGDKLPSITELRAMYSVSNTVIRDAVNDLRRAGFVVGQRGKGVFVTSKIPDGETASEGELATRVQALENRVSSLEGDEVQDLRDQIAELRTSIVELFKLLGIPFPPKPADPDAARTADLVAMSFPIPIKEALSRSHDESGDPMAEQTTQQPWTTPRPSQPQGDENAYGQDLGTRSTPR